jgi:hypothetical protein
MKNVSGASEIPKINPSETAALIGRIESMELREGDRDLEVKLLLLLLTLLGEIDTKLASLARLKRLIFGPKSEKRRNVQ